MLRTFVLRRLPLLLIVLSVVALLPVFYIGIYNHPCAADDFQNAQWTSFFGIQRELYLKWSGRYFNNLAVTLCPLHWHSLAAYRVAVIAMMAGFALAYALFIMKALRRYAGLGGRPALAISIAATALLFNNLPSLSEGFFWYSGAVTYVLPATAALCLLIILLEADGLSRIRPGMLIGGGILAAAAIGGNETMLVLCDVTLFVGWLYYRSARRDAQQRFWGWLLAICLLCSAVAIGAPGNFARQAVNPRNIFMVPANWLYYSQKAFFLWLAEPGLLLFSAIALLVLQAAPLRMPRANLFAVFLLPLLLILLLGLPAHYALGKEPPPRVMNMLYAFFLLGWLVFLLHLSAELRQLIAEAGAQTRLRGQAAALAVLVILLISLNTNDPRRANFYVVYRSYIKGIPQAYDAEMNARYARITAALGDTVGVTPVRQQAGNVLYMGDIIALKRATTNRHYAAYFGKRVVFIDSLLK